MQLYDTIVSAAEELLAECGQVAHRAIFITSDISDLIKINSGNYIPYNKLNSLADSGFIGGGFYCDVLPEGVLLFTESKLSEDANMRHYADGVRILKLLGVDEIIAFGEGGDRTKNIEGGTLYWAEDHVNLSGKNPLVGRNLDEFGPRFPDMSTVYDPTLREECRNASEQLGFSSGSGTVIFANSNADIPDTNNSALDSEGINIVSVAGVHEVISASHASIKVALGLSIGTKNESKERIFRLIKKLSSGYN